MPRFVLALAATVVGLVLLLGYKTASPNAAGQRPTALAPSTQAGTATPAGSAPMKRAGTAGRTAATRTITGPVVDTDYGPVQVKVTLTSGRLTDVRALQLPNDRPRSVRLSRYAEPILRREVLAAQSAQIDVVSGATYTSDGYARSLQAALDEARR